MVTDSLQNELVGHLWRAVAGDADAPEVLIEGDSTLESAFAVSEFAAASVAVAGMAASVALRDAAPVVVDRSLAAEWFRQAVRLDTALDPWDAIAGDYRTADGWIRLHTNAPHHKAAALAVLDVVDDRDAVEAAVARWDGEHLETAVVGGGGCAAVMRGWHDWMAHPQGAAVSAEPLVARRDTSPGAHGGFRVLDLTRVIAGPVATRFLAGLGADVLRIDPPWWQEDAVVPDMTLGKRSARLDLRTDAGLARLRELAAEADVVVHGYRADALDRLGLGDFDAIRPGIVDVAIDAYGWSGPWRDRRGFDSLVQMSVGIAEEGMKWFGRDRPTPLPVQALDHSTGYLAAAAALLGLARRADTGRGGLAHLSLARTGMELARVGRGQAPAGMEPIVVGRALSTPWGKAQLLPSPVTIGGEPLDWQLAPRPLGTDEPAFAA